MNKVTGSTSQLNLCIIQQKPLKEGPKLQLPMVKSASEIWTNLMHQSGQAAH